MPVNQGTDWLSKSYQICWLWCLLWESLFFRYYVRWYYLISGDKKRSCRKSCFFKTLDLSACYHILTKVVGKTWSGGMYSSGKNIRKGCFLMCLTVGIVLKIKWHKFSFIFPFEKFQSSRRMLSFLAEKP